MRVRLVILGIVVVLAGAALWYFPVQPVSSSGTMPGSQSQVIGLQAPLDVLGALVSFDLHWSAPAKVTAQLYRCGSSSTCQPFHPTDLMAEETGTSGTLDWQATAGQFFLFRTVTDAGPVQVTVNNTEPVLGGSAGLATIGFGGFLVALGVWVRGPPAPAPEPAAPGPSSPEAEPPVPEPVVPR